METHLLIAILALSKYAADLEESIPQTDSQNINVLTAMKVRLKEADDALKYFQNLYIYGESEKRFDCAGDRGQLRWMYAHRL